ncbi:MAG: ABC transporter ATP-binding protein, partial [Clostridia bacterium]|nr:ABC transporter ATP-binding protein [Clostridia bacterium]
MHEYFPILLIGGIIGFISIILIVAYASMKDKKQAIGFDRHMKDGEIVKRLLSYAKPYRWHFVLVGAIVLVGIAYDLISPILIGRVTKLIQGEFELSRLFT